MPVPPTTTRTYHQRRYTRFCALFSRALSVFFSCSAKHYFRLTVATYVVSSVLSVLLICLLSHNHVQVLWQRRCTFYDHGHLLCTALLNWKGVIKQSKWNLVIMKHNYPWSTTTSHYINHMSIGISWNRILPKQWFSGMTIRLVVCGEGTCMHVHTHAT